MRRRGTRRYKALVLSPNQELVNMVRACLGKEPLYRPGPATRERFFAEPVETPWATVGRSTFVRMG